MVPYLPNHIYNFNCFLDLEFPDIVLDLFPCKHNCLIKAKINFEVAEFPGESLATFRSTDKVERLLKQVLYIYERYNYLFSLHCFCGLTMISLCLPDNMPIYNQYDFGPSYVYVQHMYLECLHNLLNPGLTIINYIHYHYKLSHVCLTQESN